VKLGALLAPERIVVPLRARDLGAAVRELLAATVAGGRVADPEALERMRKDARAEDVVSLGPHAFLPHFRTDLVEGVVAALGVAPAPIPWPADPERAARIVLLVLAPPRAAARYLQALAAFARALADPEVVQALHAAADPAAVARIGALAGIELEGPLLVRDIMAHDVTSVGPETPLAEAARILVQHRWEALPVVNADGEVVGMVSNRELLQHLVPAYIQRVTTGEVPALPRGAMHPRRRPLEAPVKDAMARTVLCVSEEQSVADVASLMANKHLDRCPVVKDGRLTGFLTRADIVRKLAGG
jgi:CBS domain-containing protein